MDLLGDARELAKDIVQGDFSTTASVEFKGLIFDMKILATRRFIEIDQQGVDISATVIHLNFSEDVLKENGVVTRNEKSLVDLSGMLVTYKDSTRTLQKYIVTKTRASETFGLIVCILQRYGNN